MRCLSAILHLGNVRLEADSSHPGEGRAAVAANDAGLARAAGLLGVDLSALRLALTERTMSPGARRASEGGVTKQWVGTDLCALRLALTERAMAPGGKP